MVKLNQKPFWEAVKVVTGCSLDEHKLSWKNHGVFNWVHSSRYERGVYHRGDPTCCGAGIATAWWDQLGTGKTEMNLTNCIMDAMSQKRGLLTYYANHVGPVGLEVLDRFGFVKDLTFWNPNMAHNCHRWSVILPPSSEWSDQ